MDQEIRPLHTYYPDMAPELWTLFIDVMCVFARETADWYDTSAKDRIREELGRVFCVQRPPIPVHVNVRCDCRRCMALMMANMDPTV